MADTIQKDENLLDHLKIKLYKFPFSEAGIKDIEDFSFGKNWPVTYLIHNEKELYVGETSSVYHRMKQHSQNSDRKRLKECCIIYSPVFNKSVILDLEATLILLMSSDHKYSLQNANSGQKLDHDYYNKGWYDEQIFPQIWEKIRLERLAEKDYEALKNSDLYKFSPFHSLTEEQYTVAQDIIHSLTENIKENRDSTFVVSGSAGTGKTVLAVYLVKRLFDLSHPAADKSGNPAFARVEEISQVLGKHPLNIGLVIPQTSLRQTIKSVFRKTPGLSAKMVIGPSDVLKQDYDLLIVDEGHRLKKRQALTSYNSFDNNNRRLGLDKTGTELDWILQSAAHKILIYDKEQSVAASDVNSQMFTALKELEGYEKFSLRSQMRVMAGNDYIAYIKSILSQDPPEYPLDFEGKYDFRLYTDLKWMKEDILEKEQVWGLSRMIAGYAFEWKTKKKDVYKNPGEFYDFELDGLKCVWNTVPQDWVNSEHALDEIGCIHTIQGYDLNYAGVILGEDIKYDRERGKVIYCPSNLKDKKIHYEKDEQLLEQYIFNTYSTLLTRGIRGTFVYACDKNLQEYLKKYIPEAV